MLIYNYMEKQQEEFYFVQFEKSSLSQQYFINTEENDLVNNREFIDIDRNQTEGVYMSKSDLEMFINKFGLNTIKSIKYLGYSLHLKF